MHKWSPSKFHPNRKAHNWLIYDISDKFLEKHGALYKGVLYDLGCGTAPYKEFFLNYCDEYIGIDWANSLRPTRADIIADLNEPLPVESESADTVISLSVLEHLCEPQTMLNEAKRILKPGGNIVLQVPWQWWIHDGPHDYCRYTPHGLHYLLSKSGFEDIWVEAQSGFFTTMVMKVNYFTRRSIQGPKARRSVVESLLAPFWCLGQLAAPLLDQFDKSWAAESAGFCVTARKPDWKSNRGQDNSPIGLKAQQRAADKIKKEQLKMQLYSNILRDAKNLFGLTDLSYLLRVTNNWFDDSRNYDGRWAVIAKRGSKLRVLDMAAGCGTFVLYGLRQGKDVWGIEPEKWKLHYFRKKIAVSDCPEGFRSRVVPALGETLPFTDNSFDLVTSYQTLEYVANIEQCIAEMLRVVKPGGSLFIMAPDYTSFYEGHYRIFFLPLMPRPLARLYLKLRGRPLAGLNTLNYVTLGQLIRIFRKYGDSILVENMLERKWRGKIATWLPFTKNHASLANALTLPFKWSYTVNCLWSGREKTIVLWIKKLRSGA